MHVCVHVCVSVREVMPLQSVNACVCACVRVCARVCVCPSGVCVQVGRVKCRATTVQYDWIAMRREAVLSGRRRALSQLDRNPCATLTQSSMVQPEGGCSPNGNLRGPTVQFSRITL